MNLDNMTVDDYRVYLREKWPIKKVKKCEKGKCAFAGENCVFCGKKLPLDGIR